MDSVVWSPISQLPRLSESRSKQGSRNVSKAIAKLPPPPQDQKFLWYRLDNGTHHPSCVYCVLKNIMRTGVHITALFCVLFT